MLDFFQSTSQQLECVKRDNYGKYVQGSTFFQSTSQQMGCVKRDNNCFMNVLSQPLNEWNVSNVKDMGYMFYLALDFNQPLNNWNVMNNEAISFHQPFQ